MYLKQSLTLALRKFEKTITAVGGEILHQIGAARSTFDQERAFEIYFLYDYLERDKKNFKFLGRLKINLFRLMTSIRPLVTLDHIIKKELL